MADDLRFNDVGEQLRMFLDIAADVTAKDKLNRRLDGDNVF
jgi:hypothetical protein